MNYTYRQSRKDELHAFIEEYSKTLSSPFDSFLEDHISKSQFYSIEKNAEVAGYFAIIHDDGLLTQFYLRKEHMQYAQIIFRDVLCKYQVKRAFVVTSDELFLSLAIDQDMVIKKQAYFFQDSGQVMDASSLYVKGSFRTAVALDIPQILEVSGDFFDELEGRVARQEIFVFKEGEELLGAGIVEHGIVMQGYTSIGMFVNEKHRQKGIGRTIITELKKWCYDNGRIPICGCWYYNHNSKKTLESAGMITKTRLFNIEFVESGEPAK